MSLGSPSGFGSVRNVYFCSRFRVALSASLHCQQRPSCPWDHFRCFCGRTCLSLLAEACEAGACVALFLAPCPCPLHHGALCGLPSAPQGPPSVLWDCFISPALCEAYVFFQPQTCPVHREGCLPGEVCMPPHSWRPQPACCAVGVSMGVSQSPEPASGWGHSLQAVHGLRSATFSVSWPLIPYFAWFSKTP